MGVNVKAIDARSEESLVAIRESLTREEILHVYSDIDMVSGPAFESMLVESSALGKKTVVDLTECPYMDSTGLRLLVVAHKALGTRLEVWVTLGTPPERVLAVSCVDRLLSIVSHPAPPLRQRLFGAQRSRADELRELL
jgi:anti-anti-sigma factor